MSEELSQAGAEADDDGGAAEAGDASTDKDADGV